MSQQNTFFKAPSYLFRKHNILTIIRNNPDIKTFLDVGCGAGELDCTLAEMGKKGVGVDFSEDAINIADSMRKNRGIKDAKLQFKLGGLEKVKNKKFDLVLCLEVLEHVEDDKKLLKELIEHSNKYVLVSVPGKQKLFDSSDELVGHFRRYEKDDLKKLIQDADLEIVKFINYSYPFTNIIRIARKSLFYIKLRKNKRDTMKNRTKNSGINPITIPKYIAKINMELVILPFYHFSRLFNRYNLAAGYLVVCKKKTD